MVGQKPLYSIVSIVYLCNYTPNLTVYWCLSFFFPLFSPCVHWNWNFVVSHGIYPHIGTQVLNIFANHLESLRKWHDVCCCLRRLRLSCATFLEGPLQNRSRHSRYRGWLTQELWWRCDGQELSPLVLGVAVLLRSNKWVIIGCIWVCEDIDFIWLHDNRTLAATRLWNSWKMT